MGFRSLVSTQAGNTYIAVEFDQRGPTEGGHCPASTLDDPPSLERRGISLFLHIPSARRQNALAFQSRPGAVPLVRARASFFRK